MYLLHRQQLALDDEPTDKAMDLQETGSKRLDMPCPLTVQRGSSFVGYGGGTHTHTLVQGVPVVLNEGLEAVGCSVQWNVSEDCQRRPSAWNGLVRFSTGNESAGVARDACVRC